MATLEQIQSKLKKLQAQAEAMAAKQSSAAISTIRALMEKHGLTIADLAAQTGGKKRGRKPGVSAAVAGKAKPATAAKGKLPPKYRDPKTGATWSGHARPPAWIANVKDRTKFLIDGADVSSAVSAAATRKPKTVGKSAAVASKKPVAKKGPATKKVVVRKAATKAKASISAGSDAVKTEA